MTISANYPHPVQVNGFSCLNCAEVDLAKKHIDPAHPKSGPFDINAAHDPTRHAAVILGGALASAAGAAQSVATPPAYQPGQVLNLSV